jgi:hypothetical protein
MFSSCWNGIYTRHELLLGSLSWGIQPCQSWIFSRKSTAHFIRRGPHESALHIFIESIENVYLLLVHIFALFLIVYLVLSRLFIFIFTVSWSHILSNFFYYIFASLLLELDFSQTFLLPIIEFEDSFHGLAQISILQEEIEVLVVLFELTFIQGKEITDNDVWSYLH